MTYEPCTCKIYSCKTLKDLIAAHWYCHALYNQMKRNPDGDYKYTLAEVRAEHARIVRCLKKNGYEHNSPLD